MDVEKGLEIKSEDIVTLLFANVKYIENKQ